MRLAIIPARGGSKGLPRKNLAQVGGQTLIARCVRTCKEAGLRTIVSTDDEAIAESAQAAGGNVLWRPHCLAGDQVTSQAVLQHVCREYDLCGSDEILFAQCTAPMMTAGDVCGTCEALHGNDLAVCCVPFDGIVLGEGGQIVNLPMPLNTRRQDRHPQYVIAGSCWAFRCEYLNRPWMSGRVGIHVAQWPHRVDIDSQHDMELARALIEEPVCYPL